MFRFLVKAFIIIPSMFVMKCWNDEKEAWLFQMRPNNSVGGYRIYPTSPEDAEIATTVVGILGQFNESMDRLNSEWDLTHTQQQQLDRLNPNNQLVREYSRLSVASTNLWQRALERQQEHDQGVAAGQYSTDQLTTLLNRCADGWQQLKTRLDALA